MHWSQKWSGVFRVVAAFSLAGSLTPGVCGPEPAPTRMGGGKRALVLHSYYKGFQWTDDENRGIESVLLPELGPANLYIEYMDSKRFYRQEYLDQLVEVYRRKFMFHKFDVIVASDNNAFDLLREHRDELFPGVPVVFCGVNYFREQDLKGHAGFTGVSEEADVKDTLDLALRIHPGTQHIFVVNELTETGRTIHDEIVGLAPSYAGRADIVFLEQYTLTDLETALQKLPENSIVFYSFFARDASGRFLEYAESARAITSASNAPVYGAWDFNLGHGIVGGKLISGFYQGATAGKIATQVLRGANPAGIPVVRFSANSPNRWMFDFVQLRRWGIADRDVPKGSIIVNQPESFFIKHRQIALIGAGMFVFLAAANSILFLNISRRKMAEEKLREYQEHLEELIQKRSEQLEALNGQLRDDIAERERTERALREAEQGYRGLFENAAEGIYQVTPNGKLTAVNPALARMAGYSTPEEMMARIHDIRTDFFVHPERRREFEKALLAEGEVRGVEASVYRRDGEIIWILENARAVRDDAGAIVYHLGTVQDITVRKRAAEALRESQELLHKTFASLRDAVLIVAADTRIVLDCNPALTRLFGYDRNEVVGQTTLQLHVDEQSAEEFKEMTLTGIRERGYLQLPVFPMRRSNGEVFPTQHSVMPLYAEDGSLVSWVSVLRDVTEDKRTEAKLDQYRRKLRALAAELTVVEARERRAIAAQLHENLGQILAVAKLKIGSLLKIAPDKGTGARLSEIYSLAKEALQQTRSLTYQLSPPILYQLGIEAALKWLAENMQKQHGFRVHLSRQGESGALPDESSVFAFSAVREVLVNVAKHAAATRVDVRLKWTADRFEVLVRDNGRGFPSDGVFRAPGGIPESRDGFGLFNIRERTSDLGGRIWVRSEAGKGTVVKIQLPLGSGVHSASEHEYTNLVG